MRIELEHPQPQFLLEGARLGDTVEVDASGQLLLAVRSVQEAGFTVWSLETGQALETQHHRDLSTTGMLFFGGVWLTSERFATQENSGTIRIWEALTGRQVLRLEGHTMFARCIVEFRGAMITAGDDGTIRCWDSQSGLEMQRWNVDGEVMGLGIAVATGAIVAATRDGRIFVVDMN
jgi:WD40 repeat protein